MRHKKRSHFPSLLVATGKEETRYYKVSRDRIKELFHIKTTEPEFSDREGHFEKSRHGETIGTAGIDVENAEEKHVINQHAKKMAKKTKELWNSSNFEHLMIAAPDYLRKKVKSEIKDKLNELDYKYIEGNHTHTPKDKKLELAKESLKVV